MDRKIQALYGLKFNPFTPDIPVEALFVYDELDSFLWRIENIFIKEGGFSLITGESGRGVVDRFNSVLTRSFIPHKKRINFMHKLNCLILKQISHC